MKLTTVTVLGDEWQTEQADLLELAVRSPISPRDSFRMQLRRDGQSWLMWLLLSIAMAALGFGLVLANVQLLLGSGAMVLILGYVFVQVVRGHRRATLLRGVISDQDLLRWSAPGYRAVALLKAGETTKLVHVFVGRREPIELLRMNGQVEVLVHFDSRSRYSTTLAWRAAA